MRVQTLSQNLYVFNLDALKVILDFTLLDSAELIDLSNCTSTARGDNGENIEGKFCHNI